MTLFHNGILVQNNEEPFGPTAWLQGLPYDPRQGLGGPIQLQDHDHPVRYRNIWLRKLPERPAPSADRQKRTRTVKISQDLLDRYAGNYRPQSRPDSPPWRIARDGDHLTLLLPTRTIALALEPISETQFDMPHTDGQFTFQTDTGGKVTSVHFRIGDGERTLVRDTP